MSESNIIPWQKGKPQTLAELFEFYCNYVKPLYAETQAEGKVPQEILFELNAALDHISRHWGYNEDEASVVHKAYAHLKRACLDTFKIRLKVATDQLNELRKTDISIIDNGAFQKELLSLGVSIKKLARKARKTEGLPDTNMEVPAFLIWEEVWVNCITLEEKFYLNPHVSWARKHGFLASIKRQWVGLLLGVIASIIAAIACKFFGIA